MEYDDDDGTPRDSGEDRPWCRPCSFRTGRTEYLHRDAIGALYCPICDDDDDAPEVSP